MWKNNKKRTKCKIKNSNCIDDKNLKGWYEKSVEITPLSKPKTPTTKVNIITKNALEKFDSNVPVKAVITKTKISKKLNRI